MTPLEEVLLAVACHVPDASDPYGGPLDVMWHGLEYKVAEEGLQEALERCLVKHEQEYGERGYTLTSKGRYALYQALKGKRPVFSGNER